jgi:hypothetical protein
MTAIIRNAELTLVILTRPPFSDPQTHAQCYGQASSLLEYDHHENQKKLPFDTVAVYLSAEQDLVEMQDLPLRVTDDGYTVIDEVDGRIVHCATAWKDLPAFEKRLIDILIP